MDNKPAPYELSGKIKLIDDIRTFGSGFTKREFVVTTDEKFPQDIKFELVKEKCSLLDAFKPADVVKVSFNIRGNEYNGRYYVNLQAWRVESARGGNKASPGEEPASYEDEGRLDDAEDSPF